MARPLRLEYPGALYHVTSRGNAREAIVRSDDDRRVLLKTLEKTVGRYNWICHAYCVMDNHYHLLIETPDANLSAGMRQLNGVYTQRSNRRHGRVGHVLQGRFKATVVEKESYLLELSRYIVLNPVRAGKVKEASHYAWSSYRATIGAVACPAWLTTDSILAQFGGSYATARRRYERFVGEGKARVPPWQPLDGRAILGSDRFIGSLIPCIEAKRELKEVPRMQRLAGRPTLETLIPGSVKANKQARDEAIRDSHSTHGYTMAAIAREVGLHYSTVSKIIKGER